MKCTDCNQPVKPVVALDIDGTLGDYHDHLFAFARDYFPLSPAEYSKLMNYDGSMRIADWMGWLPNDYRQMKLAFRQGGMKRTMPPFAGAADLALAIRSAGAEVWVTTTRPYQRLDNIDPDTQEWLRRNEVPYDGLIYDEDKYHRLVEIVGAGRVVGVLEDLPTQYDRATELGLPVIQRETQYNQAVLRPDRCSTLAQAKRLLLGASNRWSQAHEQ